jgi:CUB domain
MNGRQILFVVAALLCVLKVSCDNQGDDQSDGFDHCSGTLDVLGSSGLIFDHQGDGNYLPNQRCIWHIAPAAPNGKRIDGIVLAFNRLSTEYYYDYVRVGNAPPTSSDSELANGDLISQTFSGKYDERIASMPAPFFVPGSEAWVMFRSDRHVGDRGFELYFEVASCGTSLGCGEHGTCAGVDGRCQCELGYVGDACERRRCVDGCNSGKGYGRCDDVSAEALRDGPRCACEAGRFGGDCASSHCSAAGGEVTVLTGSVGSLRDHRADGGGGEDDEDEDDEYRNNELCRWLLSPPLGGGDQHSSSIELRFIEFDLEWQGDYVRVYDGVDAQSGHLIGQYTGSNGGNELAVAHSGHMFVEFVTDASVTRIGFDAIYAVHTCEPACGPRGRCIGGACHCDVGFEGDTCARTYCVSECNDHGMCVDVDAARDGDGDASQRCQCVAPFSGPACASCDSSDSSRGSACPARTCELLAVESGTTGTISDGSGSYAAGDRCRWRITAPIDARVDSISLSFTEFDLSAELAYLSVYSMPQNVLVARYTGDALPPLLLVPTARELIVDMHASDDDVLPGSGFIAHWQVEKCAGSCSGRGVCGRHGQCLCNIGFTGGACETPLCLRDCGESRGHGQCVRVPAAVGGGARCQCALGFTGPSCGSTYCDGAAPTLVALAGTVVDHGAGMAYRPNSKCSWPISPAVPGASLSTPAVPITLVFERFAVEPNFDYVEAFDGGTMSAPRLLHAFGKHAPYPLTSSGGALTLSFASDSRIELTGFEARYSSNAACPSACHGHGYCVDGRCHCFGSASGPSCTPGARIAFALHANNSAPYKARVERYEWRYFYVAITQPGMSYMVEVAVDVGETLPILFGRANAFPDLHLYQEHDPHTDFDEVHEIRVRDPPLGRHYFGVYGYVDNRISVRVYSVDDADSDDSDPIAESPDQPTSNSGIIIVAAVLVPLVLIAIGLAVVMWKLTPSEPVNFYAPPTDDIDQRGDAADILLGVTSGVFPYPGASAADSDGDEEEDDDNGEEAGNNA